MRILVLVVSPMACSGEWTSLLLDHQVLSNPVLLLFLRQVLLRDRDARKLRHRPQPFLFEPFLARVSMKRCLKGFFPNCCPILFLNRLRGLRLGRSKNSMSYAGAFHLRLGCPLPRILKLKSSCCRNGEGMGPKCRYFGKNILPFDRSHLLLLIPIGTG